MLSDAKLILHNDMSPGMSCSESFTKVDDPLQECFKVAACGKLLVLWTLVANATCVDSIAIDIVLRIFNLSKRSTRCTKPETMQLGGLLVSPPRIS